MQAYFEEILAIVSRGAIIYVYIYSSLVSNLG